MNDETDMRRYGALRAVLPVTYATFGLGYLAIIRFTPFAGFFSKDAIIEAAFNSGGVRGRTARGAALLGAGITAFYSDTGDAADVSSRTERAGIVMFTRTSHRRSRPGR